VFSFSKGKNLKSFINSLREKRFSKSYIRLSLSFTIVYRYRYSYREA
jgi:hypothetical protein